MTSVLIGRYSQGMAECPDCLGQGEIVLLVTRRPCDLCKGSGKMLTQRERNQKLMSEYFRTPEGRRKLSAKLLEPMTRTRRDYNAITRKTFREKLVEVG